MRRRSLFSPELPVGPSVSEVASEALTASYRLFFAKLRTATRRCVCLLRCHWCLSLASVCHWWRSHPASVACAVVSVSVWLSLPQSCDEIKGTQDRDFSCSFSDSLSASISLSQSHSAAPCLLFYSRTRSQLSYCGLQAGHTSATGRKHTELIVY